jgi:hypothetical protein
MSRSCVFSLVIGWAFVASAYGDATLVSQEQTVVGTITQISAEHHTITVQPPASPAIQFQQAAPKQDKGKAGALTILVTESTQFAGKLGKEKAKPSIDKQKGIQRDEAPAEQSAQQPAAQEPSQETRGAKIEPAQGKVKPGKVSQVQDNGLLAAVAVGQMVRVVYVVETPLSAKPKQEPSSQVQAIQNQGVALTQQAQTPAQVPAKKKRAKAKPAQVQQTQDSKAVGAVVEPAGEVLRAVSVEVLSGLAVAPVDAEPAAPARAAPPVAGEQ